MSDNQSNSDANLPPRPPSFPRLIPGRIDVFRIVAFTTVVIAIVMQIVLIYADHEAYNDYGSWHEVDPVGAPFYLVGGILDLYMIGMALFVRRKQKAGNLQFAGYMPHPGFLLFFDTAVMGGLLAWGGVSASFGILGEDAVMAVYAFSLLAVAVAHLKLMVDDCRYVHYRRKLNKKSGQDVRMDNMAQ